MPSLEWRIYYGDDSTYDSNDGSPEDAPAANIQAIVQFNELVGRELLRKFDFYLHIDGQWIGVDWFGLVDHMMDQGIVKSGRCLPREQYQKISYKALHDSDFPPKSATLEGER